MLTPVQDSICTDQNANAANTSERARTEFEGCNSVIAALRTENEQLRLGVDPPLQAQIETLTVEKGALTTNLAGRTEERDVALAQITANESSIAALTVERDAALSTLAAVRAALGIGA